MAGGTGGVGVHMVEGEHFGRFLQPDSSIPVLAPSIWHCLSGSHRPDFIAENVDIDPSRYL